tara:strand:- start:425 stop:808 length:384 start_codon:yes stop_codon:yes gene_type:complete
MSTILVNTLTGTSTAGSIAVTGEGNSTTTNLQQGLAKAWCRAGSAAQLNDSFNIASGTDSGTGDYEFTLTNNMASTTAAGSATAVSSLARIATMHSVQTTGYGIENYNDSGSKADNGTHHQTFGDLA